MLRSLIKHTPIKRLTRGVPVMGLLSAAEVAMLAKGHLAKLDGAERRRLLELVVHARGRRGTLSEAERDEFSSLVAKLEPRAFAGSAAEKLSPLPVPERVLYGSKGRPVKAAPDKPAAAAKSAASE
jgi:hypothetical protein